MKPDSALIHKTLKEFFGYDAFKADQEQIISHLIGGGDAFVLMPTGGGKSLCYQLPALVLDDLLLVRLEGIVAEKLLESFVYQCRIGFHKYLV